jgi:hypothetical protein
MNKEELIKRIAELREALERLQANGNATLGAITECERWLKIIEQEEASHDSTSSDPD